MHETVIVVVGPTGVGKTSLSVEIAKTFNGEVISGDAMQVYRGMDIGTDKITREEMEGIPHHMIDTQEPGDPFSVSDFKTVVDEKIKAITERGKTPVIAGGSGLYIQAVLYDYSFPVQKRNPEVTSRLENALNDKGSKALHDYLKTIDPLSADKIHPNNHRRLIRALEVYETTGETLSSRERKQSKTPVYHAILIGLEMERQQLYTAINHRVDKMMEHGLLHEAKTLYDAGLEDAQSMKAIGYKEFMPYFRNEQSLQDVIHQLKQNSRRYAKRQYTWFKNKLPVTWYSILPDNVTKTFQTILHDLAGILAKK